MSSSRSSSTPPTVARRAEPRVEARCRVRFRSLDELAIAYTRDISRGGLFLQTDKGFLAVGTVIELKLDVPDGGEPERAVARVAYVLGPEEAAARGRKPGMGMEFLEVPPSLAERISQQLAAKPEAGDDAATRPVDILVVEDSDGYRQQIVEAVQRVGHRAHVATHGLEGLGKLMRETIDLVLSDVNMPVMDGWQLLRIVRSRTALARVPVIFLTDLGGEEERLKGYRLGVDDYLAKPFDADELRQRIARVLQRTERRPMNSADRGVLRGDLALVSLPSVLSFLEAERRTGLLLVGSGEQVATLHLAEGQVLRVDFDQEPPGLQGLERLFHVLDWSRGWFELSQTDVSAEDTIGVPTSYALMEHARRTDEANRE